MTSLASISDLEATPYMDVIRDYGDQGRIQSLLDSSTAWMESETNRRLRPFTITESKRANAVSTDSADAISNLMDSTTALAVSRQRSIGSFQTSRDFWVREYPERYPELWVGSLGTIVVQRPLTSSFTVDPTQVQFEQDTGHVRLPIGVYCPPGSTVFITYSGGYNLQQVPDDLKEACMARATWIACIRLAPEARADYAQMIKDLALELLIPWIRE